MVNIIHIESVSFENFHMGTVLFWSSFPATKLGDVQFNVVHRPLKRSIFRAVFFGTVIGCYIALVTYYLETNIGVVSGLRIERKPVDTVKDFDSSNAVCYCTKPDVLWSSFASFVNGTFETCQISLYETLANKVTTTEAVQWRVCQEAFFAFNATLLAQTLVSPTRRSLSQIEAELRVIASEFQGQKLQGIFTGCSSFSAHFLYHAC